jgi:RimJ/RimL family protein N-acetyltransferase
MIGVAGYRGRGIGTEATALVCSYGFEALALREIVLDVDPRNEPAVRAYRRVGFEQDGAITMRLQRDWLRPLEPAAAGRVDSAARRPRSGL